MHKLSKNHLNSEERGALFFLCSNYRDIFYSPDPNMTFTSEIKHSIDTADNIPIYSKSCFPHVHKQEKTRQIDEILEKNIIRPSDSPCSSPIWIVSKKADASGKKGWQ